MTSVFSHFGSSSGPTLLGWAAIAFGAIALSGTVVGPLVVVMLVAAIWYTIIRADGAGKATS